MLLVLRDQQARAAVAEQVGELGRGARRIDAVADAAGRLRGEIRDRPLRTRVAHDRDGLSRLQPARLKRERDRGDAIPELAPGRFAVDAADLRAKRDGGRRPSRALEEQTGQSVPREGRVVDHPRAVRVTTA